MKPECIEYQKKIARSLVGDIKGEEQQALDSHLATCAQCRSERENYAQTLNLMQSIEDEPVPRHFFVYPQQQVSNPWQLFRQMKPGWQTIATVFAGLLLFLGVAAVSRLHIRSDLTGWSMSFGSGGIDTAALKRDILKTVDDKNREAKAAWILEVRSEIDRTRSELTKQQQAELTAALTRLDSRLTGRLTGIEGRIRHDTQNLAADLYGTVAQQRAQDIGAINARFDSIEVNNAIKTRQTDSILDTLLQVAELRLR